MELEFFSTHFLKTRRYQVSRKSV